MKNNSKENCIFCKIIRGEIKSELVGESDNFIAILDINPKAKGHSLIISKQHLVTLLDISDGLGNELLVFSKRIISKLLNEKKAEGFNVVMNNFECAGQVVMHAHIHIVPRKKGDGLRLL